jgi:hypothetical protein
MPIWATKRGFVVGSITQITNMRIVSSAHAEGALRESSSDLHLMEWCLRPYGVR